MTARIFKYEVPRDGHFELQLPALARVLTVQLQPVQTQQSRYETPNLWALVDDEAPLVTRSFRLIGTGHPIPDSERLVYIGTFQMAGGALVLHLFETTGGS